MRTAYRITGTPIYILEDQMAILLAELNHEGDPVWALRDLFDRCLIHCLHQSYGRKLLFKDLGYKTQTLSSIRELRKAVRSIR